MLIAHVMKTKILFIHRQEKILRLHKTKRDLADSLLTDSNISRAMTIEDLRYLVEQGE